MTIKRTQNQEPLHNVVWPLGKSVYQIKNLAPRISDLNEKNICFLSDGLFRMQEIISLVRDHLFRNYNGIELIDSSTFGDIHGPREEEVLSKLPNLLHKHACDAVVSGVGG